MKLLCGLKYSFLVLYLVFGSDAWGQSKSEENVPSSDNDQLQVNWIYGAYIPKDSPLLSLNNQQRVKLYLRQTFTSPGIYVKTGLFSIGDQINDSPPEWDGASGYAQRMGSRYGQFAIQNTIAATGNMLLRYEPRYDRCRCTGFLPRTGHAVLRNFVTYDHSESSMRPQFASYGAALAAGAISSTWKPHSIAWTEGYRSVFTQVGFGVLSNWLGEFAPDILRVVRKSKNGSQQTKPENELSPKQAFP